MSERERILLNLHKSLVMVTSGENQVLPIFWRVLLMQRHFSLMQVRQCFLLLQTPCDVDVTNCSSQVVWMYPHRTTETPGLALSGKTRKEKRCSSIYKHKSYLSMI
ncbi:uncharacterized protein LOC107842771 isoform X3 [Capsicum annuum]|uniref:uncharacterized protein LOC107842771 isoform X3 n=1 Tax=Capsicum annuum TaxID=4072 RepID=UPI0007BF84D8|nr:uncharacterized protein LOC107842771 isoform X3 [Capsicum annuum]